MLFSHTWRIYLSILSLTKEGQMGQPESVLYGNLNLPAITFIHTPFLFCPKKEENRNCQALEGLGVLGEDSQALYARSASFLPPRSACRMPHIWALLSCSHWHSRSLNTLPKEPLENKLEMEINKKNVKIWIRPPTACDTKTGRRSKVSGVQWWQNIYDLGCSVWVWWFVKRRHVDSLCQTHQTKRGSRTRRKGNKV